MWHFSNVYRCTVPLAQCVHMCVLFVSVFHTVKCPIKRFKCYCTAIENVRTELTQFMCDIVYMKQFLPFVSQFTRSLSFSFSLVQYISPPLLFSTALISPFFPSNRYVFILFAVCQCFQSPLYWN